MYRIFVDADSYLQSFLFLYAYPQSHEKMLYCTFFGKIRIFLGKNRLGLRPIDPLIDLNQGKSRIHTVKTGFAEDYQFDYRVSSMGGQN